MAAEGKTLFLLDTATASLSMYSSTQPLVAYLRHLGVLYDAFNIHTDEKCSIADAIPKVEQCSRYFKGKVAAVREIYQLKCKNLQGPHGVCSSVFLDCLDLALSCLRSLVEHFPVCKDLSSLPISSTANENFFALVREQNMTPDTLEFAMLFPNIVAELLKKCTVLPFAYYTGNKQYYEKVGGHIRWTELPQIEKTAEKKITCEEKELMDDWRKSFVQSVRQITIRQQNTKSKCGTLPLYVYGADNVPVSDINFMDLFKGSVTSEPLDVAPGTDLPLIFLKDSICVLTVGEDIKLALLEEDIIQGQEMVKVQIFELESNPMIASFSCAKKIECSALGQSLSIEVSGNQITLTERVYEDLIKERYLQDRDDDDDDDVELAFSSTLRISGTDRGVKRVVKRPGRYND